jgi:hypothetical protein
MHLEPGLLAGLRQRLEDVPVVSLAISRPQNCRGDDGPSDDKLTTWLTQR